MSAVTRQVVFINAAHTITHYALLVLATASLAMVYQQPDLFGADYGPVITIGTGMFVVYGMLALPMGWLQARLGRKALMTSFFLGAGLFMILAGLCTSPLLLGLCLGGMGAFLAIYHPIGTAIIAECGGDRVGRAMGINGAFGNIGVALAPLVTGVIAAQFGWRWAFITPGVLCMAIGVLYAREPAFDGTRLPGAKPFPVIPAPIVRRAVVVLLALGATSGLVFNAFTLLLPKLIEERVATSPDLLPMIAFLAFAATICGGITQFTVGSMIDRRTLKGVFMPLAMMLVPGLLLLSFLDGWLVLPVSAMVAAAIFGQVTVNETMMARYIAPPLRAKLYSIRFTIGFLGASLASPLIGTLHQWTGSLAMTLVVLGCLGMITLVCALAFPNREEELKPELWARLAAPAE
ncbi:MFS transporter [Rhodovarius crocodyli]|uniref:MFS transporter n=1 Tax=Rhodovarius crocodyli TaxID=1979269 RepID=A0A437MMK0_9PROT|nr:MFS transporter [Rhodovarius crocodyli]RVT98861.1 MFS transporter [Rhodovarius crocodyli]